MRHDVETTKKINVLELLILEATFWISLNNQINFNYKTRYKQLQNVSVSKLEKSSLALFDYETKSQNIQKELVQKLKINLILYVFVLKKNII